MEKIPMDPARWQTGLTLDEFVNGMQTHQVAMQRRLGEVRLAEADCADFARFISPLHTLVMTEDWCGDSLMRAACPFWPALSQPRREWACGSSSTRKRPT